MTSEVGKFYASYSRYKNYDPISLTKKDIKRFDAEIWNPGAFSSNMRCLEIGAGTGAFLTYLAHKGVLEFLGIDHDIALDSVLPIDIKTHFQCIDVWEYLQRGSDGLFDRIVLLDVLEHFTPDEGFRLINSLKTLLNEKGKIIVKVPNASSPWGMSYQHGDLTHQTAYTPDSLRQMSIACDLNVDVIFDQRRGSNRRKLSNYIVNKALSWMLLTPPKMWGANIYCILAR